MEQDVVLDTEAMYPILLIPKKCTTLETNCEVTDNVYIDLNITSPDTEGNETCIYSGFCNVKLIDNYDVNVNRDESPNNSSYGDNDNDQIPVVLSEANQISFPSYNQSQVWIDPSRSPFVYNHYDATAQEHYSVHHGTRSQITVKQNTTYITQNVYNYKESIHYSPVNDFEHKKFRKVHEAVTTVQSDPNLNCYEEDEFECGVFLSQLPEEIINEKQNKAREKRKYIGLQSENSALKQLMSTDIQSVSKQRKTILFLGHDSHSGQTIQNISFNDPMLRCAGIDEVDHEVVIEDSSPNLKKKKYQCDKCKQIFDQISTFRQHMVGNHTNYMHSRQLKDVKFMCGECGKSLKNQRKFEIHCMGHGDPDLECDKCHKVFASKFTLRAHSKIHNRKYPCNFCLKSYSTDKELKAHAAKVHFIFTCRSCPFVASKYSELTDHQESHYMKGSSETDFTESYIEDLESEKDIITNEEPEMKSEDEAKSEMIRENVTSPDETIRKADSVIAKVMSNKMFLLKKVKRNSRYPKTCEVCLKSFERIGDLKRHLIEHVIKSTLAKTPVSKNGTLNILCEVCQTETFSRIDKYKAHLREHAKLTLYKCTFCDKSFSDSSNFSKHKKIHGVSYLQCDLCQRKFNSKRMITQHMEYHNKNSPVKCRYCNRMFHFESMLNKHIKCAHTREAITKFRCRFCENYFKTLKEKWDHEWMVHNVRKMIVDCLICGSKFRKYSELKRHCLDDHEMEIPPAKKLLRKRSRKQNYLTAPSIDVK